MIRTVEPDDIAIFYDQQDDPVASEMAAFPIRERSVREAHWAKILANDAVLARTIVDGDLVVGNIVSFLADGERNIGYWIGRQHWGRGHATAAVAEYVAEVGSRPLHAHVAEHNVGSSRVHAKCGFVVVGEEQHAGDPVKEIVLRLDARTECIWTVRQELFPQDERPPGRRPPPQIEASSCMRLRACTSR